MELEEKQKWLMEILPSPYNEWGISRDEFNYVNGWNSMRRAILERAGLVKNGEDVSDETIN